jgi:8-oxo-dGTP pyrophosphatase MutT (NUDIX family)
MDTDLSDFLSAGKRIYTDSVRWGGGLHFDVAYYLNGIQPPYQYVSSVRAIVFRGDSAIVVTQRRGPTYVIPGGRVEQGETPLQTLKRELLEETGWTVTKTRLFACMQFHHLGEKPETYAYPYPDFLWPIYIAEAGEFIEQAVIPDDHVLESFLKPAEEIKKLSLHPGELLLFDFALKLR